MKNEMYNLTLRFLRMNRLLLFLLIAFPITVRFYAPPTDDFVILNRIFASIGGACLLGWLFAIGHKANERLVSQRIILKSFQFFNWAVFFVVLSFILILLVSTDINTTLNGMKVHYVTPILLPIVFSLSFLITILIAAKTLVSAELNKDAKLAEYFTTILLMIFAAIGLWFIQPRIQNI